MLAGCHNQEFRLRRKRGSMQKLGGLVSQEDITTLGPNDKLRCKMGQECGWGYKKGGTEDRVFFLAQGKL